MTTTPQAPLGSGFGRDSTAAEVIAGLDLGGRHAVVTGGYSGIGIETTRALVSAGAAVTVPARRPELAQEQVGDIAEVVELDLGSLDSVAACADGLLSDGRPIDILIDSAAIMACPETRIGGGRAQNWEAQFATNHLGHFALANRLWPLLAEAPAGARVVSVSSIGHRRSPIRFDDLMWESGEYNKWGAYGQAKTANALFALQLDDLGQTSGVRAFSLHPGGIFTPLQRYLAQEEMQRAGWFDEEGNPRMDLFKTPEQGAATSIWCATSPQLDGMGGVYCEDCDIAAPATDPEAASGVQTWATDRDAAARLWEVSAELTGVNAFA